MFIHTPLNVTSFFGELNQPPIAAKTRKITAFKTIEE